MAPSTLWVALVIELQLWAVGHTVPAQVGASQGHGEGGGSSALRSAHPGNTTIPGQLALSHPQPTRATRPWGATGDQKPGTLGAWGGIRVPAALGSRNALWFSPRARPGLG